MRGANEFDSEGAERNNVARLYPVQQHIVQEVVFIQLALGQSQREVRCVNWNIDLFQQVGQRAQMIFMTVGENYCRDIFAVLLENIEIGYAHVTAIDAL